ncbi:MAG: hypothetical protein CFE44_07660 [Burkholderiales bacterium PBB4]|nr:MAG: hypothetical protein CFE44_07660 [Burkholderiales bacterium PBB4]
MLESFLTSISETWFAALVRDSLWGYPILETLHIIGIVTMFGSIALVDLRYLGLGRSLPAYEMGEGHLIKFTWAGFGLILLSGLSLFSAYPVDNLANPAIQLKFMLIALAGINMLFFTFRISKGLASLADGAAVPLAGRVSVAFSLVLWLGTIVCGRLIAYPELFQ